MYDKLPRSGKRLYLDFYLLWGVISRYFKYIRSEWRESRQKYPKLRLSLIDFYDWYWWFQENEDAFIEKFERDTQNEMIERGFCSAN